jgi:hypothetical protein
MLPACLPSYVAVSSCMCACTSCLPGFKAVLPAPPVGFDFRITGSTGGEGTAWCASKHANEWVRAPTNQHIRIHSTHPKYLLLSFLPLSTAPAARRCNFRDRCWLGGSIGIVCPPTLLLLLILQPLDGGDGKTNSKHPQNAVRTVPGSCPCCGKVARKRYATVQGQKRRKCVNECKNSTPLQHALPVNCAP